MAEVERAQTGEIYMASVIFHSQGPLHSGRVGVYTGGHGLAICDFVTFSTELADVAARMDEAFWAYISTGFIGLSAYLASRTDVWFDNDTSQVAF